MKMNFFRKIIFAILLCSLWQISNSQPVKEHGNLRIEGTKLLDEHGKITVLTGMSYGWHQWWPRFWNAETVKWLATDWKCKIVRAAMGVEHKKGYIERPEWSTKLLTNVVDAAIENDIYVIIDWHCHNIKLEEAKKFFGQMAQKYGNKPHVIYEIFNEPVKQSWTDIKAYSIEVIKEIRKYDPDNLIIVGSPSWDQDVDIAALDPITGFSNIAYSLHFYAGTHKQGLRDKAAAAISKGLPLFVSEYGGCEANGNGPNNFEEWDAWIKWMEKNDISWICWSIADKNETCSVLTKKASSKGNWIEKHLKESGIHVRKLLIEKAKN